jgi:hypothetical protein
VAKTVRPWDAGWLPESLLPASERLDLRKLRELLGAGKHKVQLATEDDLRRDFPEFELGAVPSVGGVWVPKSASTGETSSDMQAEPSLAPTRLTEAPGEGAVRVEPGPGPRMECGDVRA